MALLSFRRTSIATTAALLLAAAGSLSLAPAGAAAQSSPRMQVMDSSALKPPAGSRVAIVMFSNLQCPACASAYPVLRKAAATYHIPLVDHDVLIPSHNWSQQAALNARWFDLKSPALGAEYRDAVFANQASIYSPLVLRQFTERFARSHNLQFPFAVDPQGKLQAAVDADNNLSNRTGIHQTPTIFIVTSGGHAAPYTQVLQTDQLYQMIDQALSATRSEAPAAHRHK